MNSRPLALALACFAAALVMPLAADAQGVPRGAARGADIGNNAAGPVGGAVGGVVGGVAGGVAGGVKGIAGIPQRTDVPRKKRVRR